MLAIGAALRFYGVDWGLPYRFHVDEHQYVVRSTIAYLERILFEGDLNPRLSTYGPIPLYTLIATRSMALVAAAWWQGLAVTAGYLAGEHVWLTYVLGRSISALGSVATIYLFYVIGRRLYDHATGLLAATLVATTVSLVQAAHFFTVDSLLIFGIALAFVQAIAIMQRGDRRSYVLAGAALACAMAVKIPALVVVPVLAMAHLSRSRGVRTGPWHWSGLIDGNVVRLGLTAAVVFIAVSPYSLLDFRAHYLSGANYNAARNLFRMFHLRSAHDALRPRRRLRR